MKLDLKKLAKRRTVREYLTWGIIIALGIAIDQFTKWLAAVYLKPVVDVPIIDGVLHLRFHLNSGAAWGMLEDAPYVFNTLSVIIIIGMSFYLFLGHTTSRLGAIASAMIISGGVGNMIDRVLYGEVTDFIYFKLINFPIFNGADSFVCVGAGLLVLALVLEIIKEEREKKANGKNNGTT